jgi:hypothetical protein
MLNNKTTPASVSLPPDELLKEIKELPEFIEYRDAIRTQHNHPFSIEYMRTFEAEDKLISAILLKCHQSEAAIRADQNKKIGEWGNEHCPHRNNDFPFPEAVPSELQMPKRECRDCWQEKSGVAKLQKGEF